ncbi:ATP-binding protein [Nonomuraea salmonea]|uniref:ATP-binding protein n=1 Tax=Nonomuraea salmonea TaxID=46181 RepID=UPI002FE8BCDC
MLTAEAAAAVPVEADAGGLWGGRCATSWSTPSGTRRPTGPWCSGPRSSRGWPVCRSPTAAGDPRGGSAPGVRGRLPGEAARTPSADGGAGLGLAIAQGIVEAHDGEIGVVNDGPGCRFEIRLPLGESK